MPTVLRLEAREYTAPTQWRWVLADAATGTVLADHEVRLDSQSSQFEAFTDLDFYASWHAAPDPDQPHHHPERIAATPAVPAACLATELARSLSCAVLAMRFPVTDEFATALTRKLYDLLVLKGRDLPSALAITLRQLAPEHPALSVAAPALFGASAAGLMLKAPKPSVPRTFSTAALKMAGFPPEPDRFVGRTGVMARASAALAPESRTPGVLLHGMPGGGKTACALELAYTHEHAFDALIWYKAPDEGSAIDASLTDFALTLERYLDGFQMIHLVNDSAKLSGFLPRLTELLKRNRLLIVIDNAESLLTDSGHWRDQRWGQVIGALTAHNGPSRLILTTRRVPAETANAIARESVDALSPGEAPATTPARHAFLGPAGSKRPRTPQAQATAHNWTTRSPFISPGT